MAGAAGARAVNQGMARRLRIQYPGARYHVINRGNLQHNVFATAGAKNAFLIALDEAAMQFGWHVHAFVVMRNHYHLALATPEPNLVQGMHWLQSTFATRLTRFHGQHGHVFQGRYKALLVEDAYHLARVCDYIHLNPVRAGIVTGEAVGEYLSSSLWHCHRGTTRDWLQSTELLQSLNLEHESDPWRKYLDHLASVSVTRDDDRNLRGAYSRGWAIGTAGWRSTLARQYSHLALAPEMSAAEIADVKCARWQQALDAALEEAGKSLLDAKHAPKSIEWKVDIARKLRARVAAPYRWIAMTLTMGHPAAVRGYVAQHTLQSAD
ncbi:MAG: transposase [Opitutaceae bacterium]